VSGIVRPALLAPAKYLPSLFLASRMHQKVQNSVMLSPFLGYSQRADHIKQHRKFREMEIARLVVVTLLLTPNPSKAAALNPFPLIKVLAQTPVDGRQALVCKSSGAACKIFLDTSVRAARERRTLTKIPSERNFISSN
jgi:hypothetical protein